MKLMKSSLEGGDLFSDKSLLKVFGLDFHYVREESCLGRGFSPLVLNCLQSF
jgi:hypothetical protein